jgi:hypothetical protein
MILARLHDTVVVTGYLFWVISCVNQLLAKNSAQRTPVIHKLKEGGVKSSKYFSQTCVNEKENPA